MGNAMILAGTGHRPDKLGGYGPRSSTVVMNLATQILDHYQPSVVISGMAQGWDMALAQAAYGRKIPFRAYLPFVGQHLVWPASTRAYYTALLGKAEVVKVCSPGGYSPRAMQIRNECMVNDCDLLIALWNGSPGGTANCLQYATFVNVPFINVWSNYQELLDVNHTKLPAHTAEEDAVDDGRPSLCPGSDWLGK
jgi:hypothetical protein